MKKKIVVKPKLTENKLDLSRKNENWIQNNQSKQKKNIKTKPCQKKVSNFDKHERICLVRKRTRKETQINSIYFSEYAQCYFMKILQLIKSAFYAKNLVISI